MPRLVIAFSRKDYPCENLNNVEKMDTNKNLNNVRGWDNSPYHEEIEDAKFRDMEKDKEFT